MKTVLSTELIFFFNISFQSVNFLTDLKCPEGDLRSVKEFESRE